MSETTAPKESMPQESMEDILTSIRSGVEGGDAEAVGGDGDVLELASDDIVEVDGAAPDVNGQTNGHAHGAESGIDADEDLIDINAFAQGGEEKHVEGVDVGADVLGEQDVPVEGTDKPEDAQEGEDVAAEAAAEPVVKDVAPAGEATQAAEDEFDKLLAELGDDEQPAAEGVASPPVVADETIVEEVSDDAAVGVAEEDVTVDVDEVVVEEPVDEPVALAVESKRMALPVVEGFEGMQVALPVEVLAAALRPLVKDWVAENLSSVVERLVKEEIGKLTQD